MTVHDCDADHDHDDNHGHDSEIVSDHARTSQSKTTLAQTGHLNTYLNISLYSVFHVEFEFGLGFLDFGPLPSRNLTHFLIFSLIPKGAWGFPWASPLSRVSPEQGFP